MALISKLNSLHFSIYLACHIEKNNFQTLSFYETLNDSLSSPNRLIDSSIKAFSSDSSSFR